MLALINGVTTDITSMIDEFNTFTFQGLANATYTLQVQGLTTYSGYVEVNVLGGSRVGEFDIGAGNSVFAAAIGEVVIDGSGTFKPTENNTFTAALGAGTTLVSLSWVIDTNIPKPSDPLLASIEQSINAAFGAVKTYVDTQDVNGKAYADSKISELMTTTDLSAKLALLNEINNILDGDTATAGFQLWQASLTKLNAVVADFNAYKIAQATAAGNVANDFIAYKQAQVQAAVTLALEFARFQADNAVVIVEAVTSAKTDLVNAFITMQTRATSIFAL